MQDNLKLAVLIDADNASADIIEPLLEEIAKYGIASVKRIYGDWSSGLHKWKAALLPHAILPVQQFAYTKGKNATDMAMVIDAMDLLYSNTFDGFCIVSSDSDFTRLASRIRANGLMVYGFGQQKTPEAFRKACDKFIYTELFHNTKKNEPAKKAPNTPAKNASNKKIDASNHVAKIDGALINLLYKAVKEHLDDAGWAGLGAIGSYINKVNSDFDPRNYGFSKLSDLMKSLDQFETQAENGQLKVRKRPKNRSSGATGFSKLIPLVQKAIEEIANPDGWANILTVAKKIKQIDADFDSKDYGFDTVKAAIHAIYDDWLIIEKQNRSERVRINNPFNKN